MELQHEQNAVKEIANARVRFVHLRLLGGRSSRIKETRDEVLLPALVAVAMCNKLVSNNDEACSETYLNKDR